LPGGGQITLFPEPHRLLPLANVLRQNVPGPVPRELQETVLPPYTVEPGDVLLVQPASLESTVRLPGDQPVMPDGTINLGEYGLIVVAGLTVPQIEALATQTIQRRVPNPGPIVARIVTKVSKVFYVLGEVNAPGVYPLDGRETALDAILIGGGLTNRADQDRIILARPTKHHHAPVVFPVCYRQIVQLGDTTTNYQIAPGDRIFVPSRECTLGIFHREQPGPCSLGTQEIRQRRCGGRRNCDCGPNLEMAAP
jgi:protein involved in polysaccharide export with SLBB domain